jgi:hypothetical protein
MLKRAYRAMGVNEGGQPTVASGGRLVWDVAFRYLGVGGLIS